jgi:hypothetical protein
VVTARKAQNLCTASFFRAIPKIGNAQIEGGSCLTPSTEIMTSLADYPDSDEEVANYNWTTSDNPELFHVRLIDRGAYGGS